MIKRIRFTADARERDFTTIAEADKGLRELLADVRKDKSAINLYVIIDFAGGERVKDFVPISTGKNVHGLIRTALLVQAGQLRPAWMHDWDWEQHLIFIEKVRGEGTESLKAQAGRLLVDFGGPALAVAA